MRRACVLLAIMLSPAAVAGAQQKQPIGSFAVDVRGFYGGLGQDPVTATDLGVPSANLPGRGPGGVIGIQVYPLHFSKITFGVGAEAVLAGAHAQPHDDTTGDPVGDPIHQHMMGISPQISLNFGHRDGWSYVSAGMGPLSLATYQGIDAPSDPAPRQMTINMGAGARWFNTAHLAFCFDIRFYQTRPEVATAAYPGRQRTKVTVLSAGISIK